MDPVMMKPVMIRPLVMAATAVGAILLVSLVGRDVAFTSVTTTGLAALALMLSLPLVDSSIAGGQIRPDTAGFCIGLPVGFFLRQAEFSPELARGADRILAVALLISLVLLLRRLWARRARHSA